jgi:maltose alpha-D-glucosyltransferase/alpha-amylase
MSGSPPSNWYHDAVIYELHVRAFKDGNADGIGDFRGLMEKLDYLQDLGVTAIWLLPFYPSPLRDDGYDISDYTSINPSYGSLRDFKAFLREARRQGLRVITELVLNHTSDQHPWFQRARRARPGSSTRDFYVWSDTPERYRDARIIFKDFESSNWAWDADAGAYYWHRFYSHQPDLNFDNPAVHRAVFQVLDFWLEMGVDGLRLDAVPYLFERDHTSCENLPETHAFLKLLRAHIDARFPDRMLLAEANQWPEDAVAYFGDGDECQMAFHFPLMPRMFMAIRMEDRFPIIDILAQTPAIHQSCQWALFLRNHDELTLEMVTDEERDYMYRMYAHDPQARINLGIRHRLAPLLGNDRRVIELVNGMLFSLPGTPVVYYGDEIGMGDNIYLGDRNGVRTPMQWSADRNGGFSSANPQKLYLPVIIDPEYHAEAINVEAQQNNPHSLLWWTKRLIALRRRYRAFGHGTIEFLYPENRKVVAYLRRLQDERILVVANLSRYAQYVELDLSAFKGMTPVELFGRTEFPPLGDLPYLLTLGPHAFYWFALQPQPARIRPVDGRLPVLHVRGRWEEVLAGDARGALEEALPSYLLSRRWFGGKARKTKSVQIADAVPVGERGAEPVGHLLLLETEYTDGDPETYVLPLGFSPADAPQPPQHAVVARLRTGYGEGVLFDALHDPRFSCALLDAISRRRTLTGGDGKLHATPTRALRTMATDGEPSLLGAEQSNTSVVFGDALILKLFRRPGEGVNPDLEVGRYLTDRAGFAYIPPVAGALEYRHGSASRTLAILQGFVPNEGDAWTFTLDALGPYYERALTHPDVPEGAISQKTTLLELTDAEPPDDARQAIGAYLESARVIGRRTAELHDALTRERTDPDFMPEPITPLYQRSLYQSMRSLTGRVFRLLRTRTRELPEARQILDLEDDILRRFRTLLDTKMTSVRSRVHGDYHLGQVLYTGRGFVIIDFEGEPARPLSERRIKRSPLTDVAGMLRSFHYAAYAAVFGFAAGVVRPEDAALLEPWARCWSLWVSAAFLRSYLEVASASSFLPRSRHELEVLLDAFLLEKAVYELGYEANSRPDWLKIPIHGILQLMESGA